MLNNPRSTVRPLAFARSFAFVMVTIAIAAIPCRSTAHDTRPAPLTQYRINEFAANCLTCEMAFTGLKGLPKPGETATQFAARMESYLEALEQVATGTAPLRLAASLNDNHPDNLARWQRISRAVAGLPSMARQARKAWHDYKLGSPLHAVGQKLMAGLISVQSLLINLRDARP